jgi:hypothetical protein
VRGPFVGVAVDCEVMWCRGRVECFVSKTRSGLHAQLLCGFSNYKEFTAKGKSRQRESPLHTERVTKPTPLIGRSPKHPATLNPNLVIIPPSSPAVFLSSRKLGSAAAAKRNGPPDQLHAIFVLSSSAA